MSLTVLPRAEHPQSSMVCIAIGRKSTLGLCLLFLIVYQVELFVSLLVCGCYFGAVSTLLAIRQETLSRIADDLEALREQHLTIEHHSPRHTQVAAEDLVKVMWK